MKVLVDTNIIIDIVTGRHPFFQNSYQALKKCIDSGSVIIPASSFSDIYYIVRKSIGNENTRNALIDIIEFSTIADTKAVDIKKALKSDIKDFEDAIVCMIAKRIKADYILTRNKKDFINSPIKAIEPEEFLDL